MRQFSGLIIIGLLAALIFAPVDVPHTLDSVARVTPHRQWILTKTPDGTISASLYDHRTGMVSNQESWQFERGDTAQLRFREGWQNGGSVRASDVVATIVSNRLGEQLMQLRNQLGVEQAGLDVVASGQKPQVMRQLEEEITLARADLELRQKSLDRLRKLQAEGLVPMTALEQAENAWRESAARLRVAEKALDVGATGEKQEIVSQAASRIASLRRQIAFLENKQDKYTLTAPFAGQARFENTLQGERLLIEDTTTMIAQVPVRLRDMRYVQTGQNLELTLPDNETTIMATIFDTGARAEIINREQVMLIRAAVANGEIALTPGMPLRCRIHCGNVRIAEFLKRSVRWQ
ncbi:MAG: HlyD family secretion protein [Blastocatellia bacterium]